MSEQTARTILDYLNEDCWKAVLDYVALKDIILTERTSHRWQKVVLVYLRRVRISIDHGGYSTYFDNDDDEAVHKTTNRLTLRKADCASFESWTNKLGASVVTTYCSTEQNLKIIGENCPNLEVVMLISLPDLLLQNFRSENFKWLQRLRFQSCTSVSDRSVSSFTANNTFLEELEINSNDKVSGKCLVTIKSPVLKSLIFNECKGLEFGYLLSAANNLSGLTKLVLVYVPKDIYKQIHLVLDKLPKLEHLGIFDFNFGMQSDNFFKYVCRLSSLKHLYVKFNGTDSILEDVTRCCKELRSLELGDCNAVTARGIAAVLRNAGPRLTSFGIPGSEYLTDDDVITCIHECPNLTYLDVSGCWELRETLLPRAAAARQRVRARSALRLQIGSTDLEAMDDLGEYPELILEF